MTQTLDITKTQRTAAEKIDCGCESQKGVARTEADTQHDRNRRQQPGQDQDQDNRTGQNRHRSQSQNTHQ